jgi:hypothetical protein
VSYPVALFPSDIANSPKMALVGNSAISNKPNLYTPDQEPQAHIPLALRNGRPRGCRLQQSKCRVLNIGLFTSYNALRLKSPLRSAQLWAEVWLQLHL